ncbi:Fucosyltransferase [Balamuthia mandrillaris]
MKRRSSMKWRARDCWGLLLLVPLYMVFYLSTYLSEDCPTDHEDGKQWHTELYHRRWMEQWRPERFHSDPERWRSCLQELYPDFSSPFDYTERPVLLLAWHPLDNFLYIHQDSVRDCEVPCFLAADVSMEDDGCINEVDAFIFHPPTMHARRYNPAQKHPYQYWVVFTTEAEANYPILNDPTYRRMFDINMTYHLADDVPFTYFIDKNFYTDHWKLQPKVSPRPEKMREEKT